MSTNLFSFSITEQLIDLVGNLDWFLLEACTNQCQACFFQPWVNLFRDCSIIFDYWFSSCMVYIL